MFHQENVLSFWFQLDFPNLTFAAPNIMLLCFLNLRENKSNQPAIFPWVTFATTGVVTALTAYIIYAWLVFCISTVTLFAFLHNLITTDSVFSIYRNNKRNDKILK